MKLFCNAQGSNMNNHSVGRVTWNTLILGDVHQKSAKLVERLYSHPCVSF